jgi:hypothetical protein
LIVLPIAKRKQIKLSIEQKGVLLIFTVSLGEPVLVRGLWRNVGDFGYGIKHQQNLVNRKMKIQVK